MKEMDSVGVGVAAEVTRGHLSIGTNSSVVLLCTEHAMLCHLAFVSVVNASATGSWGVVGGREWFKSTGISMLDPGPQSLQVHTKIKCL